LGVLAVLLGPRAYSEGPPEGETWDELARLRRSQDAALERMLESGDVHDVAWAAYTVGLERRASLADHIVHALDHAQESARSGVDSTALVRVLLAAAADAGVRCSVGLLGEYLSGSFAVRGSATKILLDTPGADLLAAWDHFECGSLMCAEQLAIGSRLAVDRTPGFCLRVLRDIELTLHVVVLDGGEPEPTVAPRFKDTVPADCYARRESGFPPVVFYDVTRRACIGAIVLTASPIPVFVQRVSDEEVGASGCIDLGDAEAARLALLASLLRSTVEKFPLTVERVAYVRWSTLGEFQGAVTSTRREYENLYWSVVGASLKTGVLHLAEARTVSPRISVRLTDMRVDERPAPVLPPFESTNPYR